MPRKRSPFKSCKTAADVAAALQGITSPTVSQIAQAKLIIKMLSLAPAASEPEENVPSSESVPIGDLKPEGNFDRFAREGYTELDALRAEAMQFVRSLQTDFKRRVTMEECLAAPRGASWAEEPRLDALKNVLRWRDTDSNFGLAKQAAEFERLAAIAEAQNSIAVLSGGAR